MTSGTGGPFYKRFRPHDSGAFALEAEQLRVALTNSTGLSDAELLTLHLDLGFILIALEHEDEALGHLEAGRDLAVALGDADALIEAHLHLGTAQQYRGMREAAQESFQQGLDLCESTHSEEQVHFLLHHRGRCLVEQGHIAEARDCFEQALARRRELGDARLIASSAAALADLPDA